MEINKYTQEDNTIVTKIDGNGNLGAIFMIVSTPDKEEDAFLKAENFLSKNSKKLKEMKAEKSNKGQDKK